LPAGGLGLPCGRLTGPQQRSRTPTGLSRCTRMRCGRGGCPLYPGDGGAHVGWHRIPSRHLPLSSGQSLHPGIATTVGAKRHEASSRVHSVHPSGLPLACDPWVGRESLGVSPELHTPPLPATHVEVGTGTRALAWVYVINIGRSSAPTHPLATCTLVSHSCLACRTRGHLTVLTRPGVVRAAPTFDGVPRFGLPSASAGALRRPSGRVLSPRHDPRTPRGALVPTFTLEPFDGVGAQLCPCSIATATPQPFTVASRPAT
jgi:hypothetical protein